MTQPPPPQHEQMRFRYDGSTFFYQGPTLKTETCPEFPKERHTLIRLTEPAHLKGETRWFRFKKMWWITIFRTPKNN